MQRLRHLSGLLSLALAATGVQAGCTLSDLLDGKPLSAVPRMDKGPAFDSKAPDPRIFVSLYCAQKSIASDLFSYDAVLDKKLGLAWVNQHGGYAGVNHWHGPIPVSATVLLACSLRKAACPTVAAQPVVEN